MLNMMMSIQAEFDVKRPIDDALLLKIADGDKEALHTLYESVAGSVYGFALSITKNPHDADDVLQETFLKIYAKAGEYIPHGKPMAWIFTITRNSALSKLRDTAKTCEYDEKHPETVDVSSVSNIEQKLVIETLFRILTDEEKQIVVLHAVSGMKHREIAAILDLPVGTILSKYNRAIRRLKTVLQEEDRI